MNKKILTIAISQAIATSALAQTTDIEETIVTGTQTHVIELTNTVEITADSASLLSKAPGANFNSNGPLTGIAQLRGMFGTRVSVSINGQQISAGGPNWMDPPLSYAPSAQLNTLEVYRGIAPVSAGQETIGGAIHATTWSGDYSSNSELNSDGRLRVGAQSVNSGTVVSLAGNVATQSAKIKLAVMDEKADDSEFPDGEITPTEYERSRYDIGAGFKASEHEFYLEYTRNETGDSGTPALPMDIQYIDSDIGSLNHVYTGDNFVLDTRLSYSEIEHGMTNYHLRMPPMMTSMHRRNIATGENNGFATNLKFKNFNFGIDYHSEKHNSDIDNIHNPMFFVVNFNDAEKEIAGVYSEWNKQFSDKLDTEFGLRINKVSMDSGEVNGTPAMMMPAAEALRDNFNNADRDQSDTNVDAVFKLRSKVNDETQLYIGLAQKTRSPSYQERYLWLPMEATAGLADGRTYTGNVELDSEVSREIEFGTDFSNNDIYFSPRFFYRKVSDYIQGTTSTNMPAIMFASMMNAQEPLEFNNVDATFYGFDLDFSKQITSSLDFSAILNYVRGKRDDIDDNLYRISPLNTTLGLNYHKNDWGITLESVLYARQDKVSETQTEKETAGYGLANIKGYWKVSNRFRVSGGVDNIFDKAYQNHLSGYNRVNGSDIPRGDRLYGTGVNAYLRLDYTW
ncbi:TonB-dependent receptor plug domain-containing protein [Teredinibacter sp. KSP-S5-2]|uniref:TonB-dependent receptor plug domain-containing protein n=1 Tax=Teredinibacter sp. KSP-S5-2 TaxID=3034506 RepID=UPI002934C06B|nr:TonB-dependent receptor [Teredinibacter sp. KSP-S5-2]WNO09421.1 TonB-dependent receptor [Teredinibacter sp. KSP-S5-2]